MAAMLLTSYAEGNQCQVAVVSGDDDFKRICERSIPLLHFRSIAALTELIVSTDEDVQRCKRAVEAAPEALVDAVVVELGFTTMYADQVQLLYSEVVDVDFGDINVVAIGQGEYVVAFTGVANLRHKFEADFLDPEGNAGSQQDVERDEMELDGTAKLTVEAEGPTIAGIHQVALSSYEHEFRPRIYRVR